MGVLPEGCYISRAGPTLVPGNVSLIHQHIFRIALSLASTICARGDRWPLLLKSQSGHSLGGSGCPFVVGTRLEKMVMEDAKLCTRLPPGPGRNGISGGIAGMGGLEVWTSIVWSSRSEGWIYRDRMEDTIWATLVLFQRRQSALSKFTWIEETLPDMRPNNVRFSFSFFPPNAQSVPMGSSSLQVSSFPSIDMSRILRFSPAPRPIALT